MKVLLNRDAVRRDHHPSDLRNRKSPICLLQLFPTSIARKRTLSLSGE